MKINYSLSSILLAALLLAGCNNSSSPKKTNNTPIVYDANLITVTDTPLNAMFSAEDRDNDMLAFQVTSQPTSGTLLVNPDGSFVYTPASEIIGSDQIKFRAYDGVTYSREATVNIDIQRKQENFSSYSRASYQQAGGDKPTGVNGRDFNQDVISLTEFQDLVDNGEQ